MSQSVTPNYQARTDAIKKVPVFLGSFSGVPKRYATGRVQNALGAVSATMGIPMGDASRIFPEIGRSAIGGFKIPFRDENDELTELIIDGITQKEFTLKGGYADLDEADFATLFTGVVDGYELTPDLIGYNIVFRDRGLLENK